MSLQIQSASLLAWSLLPVFVASAFYLFFISASVAIARSRTSRLEELQGERSAAGRALRILHHSDRYLLCSQFGRLFSSLCAGFCLALSVRAVSLLVTAEHPAVQSASFVVSAVLVLTVLAGLLVLVQICKAVSLQHPEEVLCRVSRFLIVIESVFGPVLVFANRAINSCLQRFHIEMSNEREITVSADDLSELVKMSSEKGAIEKDEQDLLEGVVELSERITREVMTPRGDIVWVKEQESSSELVNLFTKEGVSRVLVCGKELDEVRGVLVAKDLFPYVGRTLNGVHWQNFVRAAYFVPDTKPVRQLLKELRQRGVHLAVVLNEHGGVDGIVTLEDLVEEIVGDIFDEFDSPVENGSSSLEQDGVVYLDGLLTVERIKTDYGVEIPEGEYDTVAGFILAHLGRVPSEGESFDCNGWTFVVTEVHKHRIARLSIRRSQSPVPESPQEVESFKAVNGGSARRR